MTDKETREKELLELIADAENLATVHAKEYSETYNSIHEAYAILKEETEEACDEVRAVEEKLDSLWGRIKNDQHHYYEVCFDSIYGHAKKGIVELLHVIAVCNKIEGMK